MERWLPVRGFTLYEVSDQAEVRRIKTKKHLTPSDNGQGSLRVLLKSDDTGGYRTQGLARIVCIAFHDYPDGTEIVDFIDHNHHNCKAENVRWKPRWFVQERMAQHAQTEPVDFRRVQDNTGRIYNNSLEAARHYDVLEKYILIAAHGFPNSLYGGTSWEFVN